jgi:putative MATE family efflux protein
VGIARSSPHDREIARLAVPAFFALVAEPLYLLADTAIVGHLGTAKFAGFAVAGAVLTAAFGVFNFLAYSTTAAVARRTGAGDCRAAAHLGVDGLWLATGLGILVALLGLVFAPVIVDAMGASTNADPFAVEYLRISIVGAPFLLLTLAGAGYLRGVQDTRTTLVIAVAANVLNLALELVLVYGFDLGIAGSAWGTVIAQLAAALAYVVVVGRAVRVAGASARPDRAGIRDNAVVGSRLVVRTASLLVAFLVAASVAARLGDDDVAAHQIAMQVTLFFAFALDAIAIAAQAMVGKFLGAATAEAARAAARRMIEIGIVLGVGVGVLLAAGSPWIVRVFTSDSQVQHLAEQVLWIVAAIQPAAAVVFVLDGVLIGAGDAGYLAVAMLVATFAVFLPLALVVEALDAGLLWLWAAIAAWIGARLVGTAWRFAGSGWAVTGASR